MTTRLTFKFANFDNKSSVTEVDATPATTVKEVKERLLQAWPESYQSVTAVTDFRLICMGKVWTDSKATMRSLGVRLSTDYPTPVHVSVNMSPKKGRTAAASSTGTKTAAGQEDQGDGCCIIS